MPNNFDVSVVTVTYGQRAHLLNEVLAPLVLNSDRIRSVIIVNNNGTVDLKDYYSTPLYNKIRIIHLTENTGSANGFATGISTALSDGSEYILLLDDDNLLPANGITTLLELIESQINPKQCVLTCLRQGRQEYEIAARTGRYRVSKNSFLGFSILDRLNRLLRSRTRHMNQISEFVPLPVAPYGGTLFHRSLPLEIGLPNRDLFLYYDDQEYFSRAKQAGFSLYLARQVIVADIDTSWNRLNAKSGHYLTSQFTSEAKVYYVTRNSAYLAKRYQANLMAFLANAGALIFLSSLHTLTYERDVSALIRRLSLLGRALADGTKERLGVWRGN